MSHQVRSYFGLPKITVIIPLLTMPASSLAAQTLEIKLVDGRSGRPMVGTSSYVNVWVGRERKEAIGIPTDDKGVARVQLTRNLSEVNVPKATGRGTIVADHPVVKYDEILTINVPYILCEADKTNHSPLGLKDFSTEEIFNHGYASANTCGRPKASPQPGQVVLFVRPLTFLEKMRQ